MAGFTGGGGLAGVLPDGAGVFTEGRYILEVEQETDPAFWERRHIINDPPPAWLAAHASPSARIGYDPMLISEESLTRYPDAGLTMVPVAANPVDAIWHDRPPPPLAPASPHDLVY